MEEEQEQLDLDQVSASQVNKVMEILDQVRRQVKSDFLDLQKALAELDRLYLGTNTSEELSKVTEMMPTGLHEVIPKVDTSMFTLEKLPDIQKQENVVSTALSYLFHIEVWLSREIRGSDVAKDINVKNVNEQQVTGVQVRHKSVWNRLADAVSVDRPARRANQNVVGIHESQFAKIEYVYNRWQVFVRQFHYKFVPTMTEFRRSGNSIALSMTVQTNLRNFQDVQRIILSVIPVGYRNELDQRLQVLAQSAQNLSQARQSELAARAMAAASRPIIATGNGLGGTS